MSRPDPVRVLRLADAPQPRGDVLAAIDRIFYETAPLAPAENPARAAFRDRWLGQYLCHEPHLAYLACRDDAVIGYLVGCHIDPSTSPRFSGLAYFQTFAAACARFPAHLHINLTAAARGHGTGAALLGAFAADTAAAGLPGLHVVTSAAARNVGFYLRNGFSRIDATQRNGGEVVFLGRSVR